MNDILYLFYIFYICVLSFISPYIFLNTLQMPHDDILKNLKLENRTNYISICLKNINATYSKLFE